MAELFVEQVRGQETGRRQRSSVSLARPGFVFVQRARCSPTSLPFTRARANVIGQSEPVPEPQVDAVMSLRANSGDTIPTIPRLPQKLTA